MKYLLSAAGGIAVLGLLSACGGSSYDSTSSIPPPVTQPSGDQFTGAVTTVVATSPDDTEPAAIDAVAVTAPDDTEPQPVS